MPINLEAIIFDLDGTAMPSGEKCIPSKALIETTKKYKTKIHLCAATGRTWQYAKQVIQSLELSDPCIICGGAIIIDPVSENILWQEVIKQPAVEQIIQAVHQFRFPIQFSSGLLQTVGFPKILHKQLAHINTCYILDIPENKVNEVVLTLKPIQGIIVSKAYSWNLVNGIDLHITSDQSTKEHAVFELCRMLGIESTRVAGVGDGFNDLHLFNAVGYKVAIGNAAPELKAHADRVIGSIEEDGLAKYIVAST